MKNRISKTEVLLDFLGNFKYEYIPCLVRSSASHGTVFAPGASLSLLPSSSTNSEKYMLRGKFAAIPFCFVSNRGPQFMAAKLFVEHGGALEQNDGIPYLTYFILLDNLIHSTGLLNSPFRV